MFVLTCTTNDGLLITFLVLLALIQGSILGATNGIEIVRYWNGMANKNEKATMAVKTDDRIRTCTWKNDRKEYR